LNKATVDFIPGAGLYVDLPSLEANPEFPDPDLFDALPAGLKSVYTSLDVCGKTKLKTWLKIAVSDEPGVAPDVWWDGSLWLDHVDLRAGVSLEKVTGWAASLGRHNGRLLGLNGNVQLDRATVFNQPFKGVHCKLQIQEKTPDVMVFNLKAPVFGGQITGQGWVEFTSMGRYELDLTALQTKLDEFGEHNLGPNPPQLNGGAEGWLYLSGKGSNLASLEGQGRLDMPKGKLYNLPLLLDLLSFLGLRWPDRALFSEAHASFNIRGQRVGIDQIDLL